MQSDTMGHSQPETTVESAILNELRSSSLDAKTLWRRARDKVPSLKEKECKSTLAALISQRKIHGLPKKGKNGKPTKTIESYALGAPPPPPPPPRELAPNEILVVLKDGGPLKLAELKKRVGANVRGLTAADWKAVLAELVGEQRVHTRRERIKHGSRTKTIESYALGAPPPDEFVDSVLAALKQAREAAADAGVEDRTFVAALLEALAQNGVAVRQTVASEPPPSDRDRVLRSVHTLVAREGRGALIPIRKLRASLDLAKDRFDAAVLSLHADDAVILHHHDYVGGLAEAERQELVVDPYGNYYVGVALRGG